MVKKNDLISYAKEHYLENQVELLSKAIDFATQAHAGQKRASGEPYISHPLTVANTLIEWGMDIDSVVAGVLHDTVEDADVTLDEIKNSFNEDIASLVDGTTKVSQARSGMKDLSNYLPQTKDNLSKLLIALGKDIRVLIIKLADRLHNLNTLQYLSNEKQIKVARESLEVFAQC